MTPTFCTFADSRTLPAARVLAAGLHEVHPRARIVTALAGGASPGSAEPFELMTAASAPALVGELLDSGAELVVYLDPRTAIHGELEPVLAIASAHGVAVVSRVAELPEDGRLPDAEALREAGPVSDTLLAFTPGPPGQRLLQAWSADPEAVASAGAYPAQAIVTDPGCGVSAWNLHERPLTRKDGVVLAAGAPLRSMSFAGFRPDRPYWLSETADRVLVVEDPILGELCGDYAHRLLAAGWVAPVEHLGGLQRLGNGHRIDHLMRRLWREHYDREGFGDPLRTADADSFIAWLRAPAEHGSVHGVNRYLYSAYLTRPDLQDAFPDLDGVDGERFMEWAWAYGKLEVLPELLPPAVGDGGLSDDYRLGVNVVGYLRDTLGLAEAARLYVDGLVAAGIPVTTTAIRPDMALDADAGPVRHRAGHMEYRDRRSAVDPAFNLVCANGDQLEAFMRSGGAELLAGRPTIGQWGWETDVLPQSWLTAFRHLDEIWVYTSFVAENLGRIAPVPVVVVPMAISVPDVTGIELEMLDDQRFTFLFMLDFFSTLRRKNAVGLVRAFTRAFVPGEGPRLLIKTINATERPQAYEELRYEAGGRPDIEIVDSYLDPLHKSALLAGADCYVSLHRSEGFGLPLAEAMALGTPVIATGYSGNLDFMTPHNSWLVDARPSRVGPDSEIYPPHGTWGEPDLDQAAALMRHVWSHPDEAAARAERARGDIERLYSPWAAGVIARGRLERLLDTRAAATVGVDGSGAYQTIERELAVDVRVGAEPAPRGIEGAVRRGVLRLMAPFTYHQRTLDRAVFDALRDLRGELDRERRARRADRARLQALEDALDGEGSGDEHD